MHVLVHNMQDPDGLELKACFIPGTTLRSLTLIAEPLCVEVALLVHCMLELCMLLRLAMESGPNLVVVAALPALCSAPST